MTTVFSVILQKLSHFDSAMRLPFVRSLPEPATEYTAPSVKHVLSLFIKADPNDREIVEGQTGSFPADIWSLGNVVFFAFSGQSPNVSVVVNICSDDKRLNAKAMAHTTLRKIKCSPHLHGGLSSMLDYVGRPPHFLVYFLTVCPPVVAIESPIGWYSRGT